MFFSECYRHFGDYELQRISDCVHYDIIRPHHSTTYVDVAYCYRRSSVVTLILVCLSRSWVLQIRLNRSRWPLDYGLGWVQGTMC